MQNELIQIKFHKIMQTKAYTTILLGTEEKQFALYTESQVGKNLQMHLTQAPKPRPLTHDLIEMIFRGLQVRVKQMVITDIQDTVYFAKLFIEQEIDGHRHIVELDARPSDCITLALLSNAPVYTTLDVLNKSVAVVNI